MCALGSKLRGRDSLKATTPAPLLPTKAAEIGYDCDPGQPERLPEGWELAKDKPYEHGQAKFFPPNDAPMPSCIDIQPQGGTTFAMDFRLKNGMKASNAIQYTADYVDDAVVYTQVQVESVKRWPWHRKGVEPFSIWIAHKVGGDATKPTRIYANEWLFLGGKPRQGQAGWRDFDISLRNEIDQIDEQRSYFERRWRYAGLSKIRLRGWLRISPIGLYESR